MGVFDQAFCLVNQTWIEKPQLEDARKWLFSLEKSMMSCWKNPLVGRQVAILIKQVRREDSVDEFELVIFLSISVVDVKYPFDSRSSAARIADEMLYAICRLTKETEIIVELNGEPLLAEMPLEEFLRFPILNEQIGGNLDLIESVFLSNEKQVTNKGNFSDLNFVCDVFCLFCQDFGGINLVTSEDGTKMLTKFIYPHESSNNSDLDDE